MSRWNRGLSAHHTSTSVPIRRILFLLAIIFFLLYLILFGHVIRIMLRSSISHESDSSSSWFFSTDPSFRVEAGNKNHSIESTFLHRNRNHMETSTTRLQNQSMGSWSANSKISNTAILHQDSIPLEHVLLQRAYSMKRHCNIVHPPPLYTNRTFRSSNHTKDDAEKSYDAPVPWEDLVYPTYVQGIPDPVPTLPFLGILSSLETASHNFSTCIMPPKQECDAQAFTVVFLAHKYDRLHITLQQIKILVQWDIVQDVILVWNGPHRLNETIPVGKQFLDFMHLYNSPINHTSSSHSIPTNARKQVHVRYPLLLSPVLQLKNDLMNRYHPQVLQNITTQAILYYDDDGPFYSYSAIQAGFELWKRHSHVQVGAMGRHIQLVRHPRNKQQEDLTSLETHEGRQNTQNFIPYCPSDNHNTMENQDKTQNGDALRYKYQYFANYDANMVLPSGSFLHTQYLCFLWHPIFSPIRYFVQQHPVHPDDMAVSMIVSQLAGEAPRVYSRVLHSRPKQAHNTTTTNHTTYSSSTTTTKAMSYERNHDSIQNTPHKTHAHRKLMFNIDWGASGKMNEMKQYWAVLREQAIDALVRYFGSLNSGSIGWCENTPYYEPNEQNGKCRPIMANIGSLPWMQLDGTPKDSCP